MKYICFEHRHLATFVCPHCQNPITVGRYFKEPVTTLAWRGAESFVQAGEVFTSLSLTKPRILRFIVAMRSPACCEYLQQYPAWYRQFVYLTKHPEML